jgi:three-Cys-motif partner protein
MTIEDMCLEAVSVSDGLGVRCVGEWSYDKVYTLLRYLDVFATSMSAKWQGQLGYIEICSGPGRCIQRDNGEEMDGTSLAIINSPAFGRLREAVFIDSSPDAIDILQERFRRLGISPVPSVYLGDYKDGDSMCALLAGHEFKGLNLIFVDPTDCSFPFTTLKALRDCIGRFDLIMNVAIGTDVARNIKRAILDDDSAVRAKYAEFLGDDSFFRSPEVRTLAARNEDKELRIRFVDAFRDALRAIGLVHFDAKKVRHYYYLVFASASPLGLGFWKKINAITSGQQRMLF